MTTYDYIREGDAIYRKSFAIIREEADLSSFSEDQADIAVRMIHACGLVEAAAHFRFSPDFVSKARGALHAGKPIFCDAEMVAHGITRARLPADNQVICTLRDSRTIELAKTIGNTRSAAALDFPAIVGITLVVSITYLLVNLTVDLSYALLDPRVRR